MRRSTRINSIADYACYDRTGNCRPPVPRPVPCDERREAAAALGKLRSFAGTCLRQLQERPENLRGGRYVFDSLPVSRIALARTPLPGVLGANAGFLSIEPAC